jgi:hypothetical protein
MLYQLIQRVTRYVDRLIEFHGFGQRLYVAFHPEWNAGRMDAWRDPKGNLEVECWRFAFTASRPLPKRDPAEPRWPLV